VECPWDREQDERSIVPHTVEEAYELADAANAGDDAKMVDELGDVLFQVLFLSLLLEERGQGDLAQVADGCREKLIRRHPHVFGDREASSAEDVVRNWDQIKRDEEGLSAIAETLPATLYARKVQRRSEHKPADPIGELRERVDAAGSGSFEEIGEMLFAAIAAARAAGVDPELALREAAHRHMEKSA
jgi:MazG family protein